MSFEKGHKLGPYEIEAPAGAGGMGEVFRAQDTRLNRTVAIKVLPQNLLSNSDARSRFEREAKTIASLNHPNICTLYDIGHEDDIDYLVMEFLEGETLQQRLLKGKIPDKEILTIGEQIASALDTAHRKGLVHRDLKPGNIILTKEGAKLLDFGLAKLQSEIVKGMSDKTQTTPLTGSGMIVGTLQYMSPEQLEGKETDARSDIFSLGATLYEMMTGQKVFSGDSQASLIGSIMKEEPGAVSVLNPSSSPAIDRLIKKCLAKDPDDRWQTAKDLKDEIEWLSSSESQIQAKSIRSSKRKIFNRIAIVLLLAVASVSTFLWFKVDREREKAEIASKKANDGQQFLSDVLTSSFPPGFGDQGTVLDILNSASQKLTGAFPDDPEVESDIRSSLGKAFQRVGHHEKSKSEFLTALSLRENALGLSHDKTLESLDDLWLCYMVLNDTEAKLENSKTYLKAVETRYEPNSEEIISAKSYLVGGYAGAQQITNACNLAEDVWHESLNLYGPDSSETFYQQIRYAWLLHKLDRIKEAEGIAQDALIKSKGSSNPDQESIRKAKSCLAAILISQGLMDSAKALYEYQKVPDKFGIEHSFQGEFDLKSTPFQLIGFFETWCPFSAPTMEELAKVDRQYNQLGLNIVGMTRINRSASKESVTQYIKDLGIEYPVFQENGRSWNYFNCDGTPSVRLLYDGYLIWEKQGYSKDPISTQMLEAIASYQGES